LALDDTAECPSEYFNGVVGPVEAATINHAKLLNNFCACTHWVRNNKWTLNDTHTDIDAIATILDWSIPVREIYRNIEF
jgi:hypothetical protein